MSNVTLAASAGFCFGVKRAIEMAYAEIEKNNGAPLYSYGPLIHNKEVTRDLDEKGLHIIEDLEGVHEGTVVIRSHGVGKGHANGGRHLCVCQEDTHDCE